MLCELRARQLGVIEDLALVLGPGMTALTGETGAGKTLVVEAIQLLLGSRADAVLVRPGAVEAVVEGRFTYLLGGDGEGGAGAGDEAGTGDEEEEVVLTRVVPAEGRSRAYVDGRMATAGALADLGERLVDLHGQNAHQSLFSPAAQRDALDDFAGSGGAGRVGGGEAARGALRRRQEARASVRQVEQLMVDVGGSAAERSKEMELLRFQLAELEAASIAGPTEADDLLAEQERLAGAASHRACAAAAHEGLAGEDQVLDRLGAVVSSMTGHSPLSSFRERLKGLSAELADASADLRQEAEALEDDPQRLAAVNERLALLHELRRKYAGPAADLPEVLAFQARASARLAGLEDLVGVAGDLGRRHEKAMAELRAACQELGRSRREAAKALGRAVEAELRKLAMPRARFEARVAAGADDLAALAADNVTFMLAANAGEPLLPLSKVASGGELARAMLALRLVLLEAGHEAAGPYTLVFDEVDAGIGGEAALAVGRALAELARRYQVIVVTHLAQVAAFAQAQVVVKKTEEGGRTLAGAVLVEGPDRVTELSRMMSGQPGSETARLHAEELLAQGSAGSPPTSPSR